MSASSDVRNSAARTKRREATSGRGRNGSKSAAAFTMSQEDQVKINYDAFKKLLPSLLKDENKYALLRDAELIAVYDTMSDAVTTANKLYDDGLWSIQRITEKPINLGYRSRALHIR
jgi:hypothetical protein